MLQIGTHIYTKLPTVCTDRGTGHSGCPLSRCDLHHWMKVPTHCCRVLRSAPDPLPPQNLWAFSVWACLEWIQCLSAHTPHLEKKQDNDISIQVTERAVHQLIYRDEHTFECEVNIRRPLWWFSDVADVLHEKHVKSWVILLRSFENSDKYQKSTSVKLK